MNLFAIHSCPVKSAQELPDIHVNKMLQEAIQLLSVAHFELDGQIRGTKPSHNNHPSAVFVRACKANYTWTLKHARAMLDEYTFRTGKHHGYEKYYSQVTEFPANIHETGDTDFPMCMDDFCKKTLDVHKNYRYYLNHKYTEWRTRTDKKHIIVKWTKRSKPEWVVI